MATNTPGQDEGLVSFRVRKSSSSLAGKLLSPRCEFARSVAVALSVTLAMLVNVSL